jgi:hypothetical protein
MNADPCSSRLISRSVNGARSSPQNQTLAAINRLVHHATIMEMNVETYRRKAALKRKRWAAQPQ